MGKGKKIRSVFLISLVVLLLILIRVVSGSYKEYHLAMKNLEEKNIEMATLHFNRAIRFYTPFNTYVRKSIDGQLDIGKSYEKSGNNVTALDVYEKTRSSILSTRSFYSPYKKEVKILQERIADLRARSRGGDAGVERILSDLSKDHSPSVFYSIVSIFGFLGWIATTIFFIIGFAGTDRVKTRKAFLIGVAFFVFYILWLLGLAKA